MGKYDISIKLQEKGVDLSTIFEAQEKELQRAVKFMAMNTYDKITRMAQDSLYNSRLDYMKSLKFQDLGNLFIISISEPGIYFEDGFDPFSQKEGLLSGPHHKTTEDGRRYNIVPLQHRPSSKQIKPDGIGRSRTRWHRSKFQKELKHAVKNMVSVNPREMRDKSGRTIGHVIAEAQNTEGRFEGMIKVAKKYNKATQHTYLSFRGIGEDTDPTKWLHPGTSGLKAFDKVEESLDSNIDQIVKGIFGA